MARIANQQSISEQEEFKLIEHYNKAIGYDGEQSLFFIGRYALLAEYLLQQYLPKIYGISNIDNTLDIQFHDAIDKVFGPAHRLVFEKVKINPELEAFPNFLLHLEKTQTTGPINVDDKDISKSKKELGIAIKNFATDSDQKHLEEVKIKWLYFLKGEATLDAMSSTALTFIIIGIGLLALIAVIYFVRQKKKLDKESRIKI